MTEETNFLEQKWIKKPRPHKRHKLVTDNGWVDGIKKSIFQMENPASMPDGSLYKNTVILIYCQCEMCVFSL